VYAAHLANRKKNQTIMLGFSDGTKDGGYLMANWGIFKAKENLSAVSKEHQVEVLFFDGRGGPPSRGGGKTHKFYASMGKNISNKEIQLTVQGQTVSSSFGTVESAQFNIEQLLHAGITNELFNSRHVTMDEAEEELMQLLAEASFAKYSSLKNHPRFTDYLSQVSPLKFYSETNIGSRPAKRTGNSKLSLKDLRAIPYVGAWAQLKQNVTGYFGVGTALKELDQQGKFEALKILYNKSLFFKTLLDNCEMSMKKCFFPLTEFLSTDPKYSDIWTVIYDEFNITKQYILKISGKKELMSDYPVDNQSIAMRERIVLPLLTIQQFAIMNIREIEDNLINSPLKETYEKLIMRSSFGIINAGRNSA
jgi:phosphoenolpyruvate carboxylase